MMKIHSMILVSFVLSACLTGCGGSDDIPTGGQPANGSQPITQDPYANIPDADLVKVNVTSAPSTSPIHVAPNFIGLSWEKSVMYSQLFHVDNAAGGGNLIKLMKLLSVNGHFRIGANTLRYTRWDQNGPGGVGGTGLGPLEDGKAVIGGKISPPDVDALAQLIKMSGWQISYGIPASYQSRPADFDTSLAKAEAKYANKAFGPSLAYFEIGNEPEYTNIAGLDTASKKVPDWINYADAIQSRDGAGPSATLTSWSGDDHYNEALLASPARTRFRQLNWHHYAIGASSPKATTDFMLKDACSESLVKLAQQRTALANKYGISGGWRMNEANTFSGGGKPGISDSFASSLWALQFMFCMAENGAQGVDLHLQDDTSPEYIEGHANNAYPAIRIVKSQVIQTMPEYYGIKLFSLATNAKDPAGSTLLETKLDVPEALKTTVFAYATTRDAVNGGAGINSTVTVINENPTQAIRLIVPAGQAHSASYERLTSVNGKLEDGSTSARLNESGIGADGTWNPKTYPSLHCDQSGNFEVNVPPASGILISLLQ